MVLRIVVRAALCVSVLALAVSSPAAGPAAQPLTTVRGRVDLQRQVSAPERRPNPVDPGDPVPRDTANRRRAVVYFETAPRGAFEDREPPRASLDQRNETFVPQVLAVSVGTTVDFPNNDRTYHNVFSLSKAKRFDLGRYAAGRSKSVRFDRPGIVRVFCDIHSHMNAYILVFAHRYFAVTDPDGRYEIGAVPPGTYTLSAWFDGAVREQKTLTVTGDTSAVDLDFVVR